MAFGRKTLSQTARLPFGQRVYAIGDIHGEIGLLHQLLRQIRADAQTRGPAVTTLISLGDIIDRGDGAAELALSLAQLKDERFIVLKGNHEAWLVACYRGDEEAMGFWLRYGGRATMLGFGVSASDMDKATSAELLTLLQSHVPSDLIEWIEGLPTSWTLGDYFFAHAGIRPGVKLERQDPDDLMWIRHPFLKSRRQHPKIIVHGHTIEQGLPRLGGNRIGVDTGGHEHRCLTAIGLQGTDQWIIQATEKQTAKDLCGTVAISA